MSGIGDRHAGVLADRFAWNTQRDDQDLLAAYSGERFRPRFTSRLFMRRILTALDDPRLVEVVCLSLRIFPASAIARALLFGPNSFPGEPTDTRATARLA